MRKILLAAVLLATLAGCGRGGGIANRQRPDEFAVSRAAPLVVPPDFALVPPRPGEPRAQDADSSTQALQAMFGGAAQRSTVESSAVQQAGGARAQAGIRSEVGDPRTDVVDKGSVTRDIIAAPEGAGQEATASTPK
jgi:Protein of unknown function (DUF3035)/Prokaryotic membrane lipoprotein lipid attachment site